MNGARFAIGLAGLGLWIVPAAALEVRLVGGPQTCARLQRVEWTLAVEGFTGNPYDPEEISLDLLVREPSGAERAVPAFYWEGFTRELREGAEVLTPTGESGWRARFLATESGTHELSLRASGRAGEAEWHGGRLEVAPAEGRGLVRISPSNPRYFAHDDGSPYFALGHNVCWPNQAGTFDYDDYLARMGEAGENYSRLWLGPGGFTAFATQHQDPPRSDLRTVDQQSAWRLDTVLETAGREGIALMLCIESFNYLRISDPYPAWTQNAYRQEVGGPIERPGEFFTDPEARKWFQNRLRYLVARYAAFPEVLSWEFWNEVDLCEGYTTEAVAAWHGEMARYLRALDPWDHLITTSYAGTSGDPAVDGLPEMDYVQSHNYGAADMAAMMAFFAKRKHEDFARPHYFGEFGAGAMAEFVNEDAKGVHLHEGIWASTMSGDAGCAALWWWDNYIRPNDLYGQFRILGDFVAGAPFTEPGFGPRETEPPRRGVGASAHPLDVELTGDQPFDSGGPREVRFPYQGGPPASADFPRYLHGVRNHPDLHDPVTLHVSAPHAWTLGVRVDGVSGYGGAALRVSVDEEEQLFEDLPDTASVNNETVRTLAGVRKVAIPAGEHRVVIENPGNDWIEFGLLFEGYSVTPGAPLRVFAIGGQDRAYLWIRHAAGGWRDVIVRKRTPETETGAETALLGLADGAYRIEWFDTWEGRVTEVREGRSEGGRLVVPLPPVSIDAAVRIAPAG